MIINEKIEEKIEIFNGKCADDKMLFINGFEFPDVKYITVDKIYKLVYLEIDPWTTAAKIPISFIESMRMVVWHFDLKDVLISF